MADKEQTNPVTSLFSNLFTQVINFRLPFLPPVKKDVVKVETERKAVVRDGEVVEVSKTATVTFPAGRKKTVEPLKLESEDAERETYFVVLWQVYVIGGVFIHENGFFIAVDIQSVPWWHEGVYLGNVSDEITPKTVCQM